MASSSVSSQPKIPSLSYAERARKAQNIRSPISHISIVHSIAPATSSNAVSNHSVSHTAASKPPPRPVPPQNDPTPSLSVSQLQTPHSAQPLVTTVPVPAISSSDLATKALSIVAAHTATSRASTVNVWSLRSEQMAAMRPPLSRVPQPNDFTSQNVPIPPEAIVSPSRPLVKSPSSKIVMHSAPNSAPGLTAVNDATSSAVHDPSALKSDTNTPHVTPPVNNESWPEIGKVIAPIERREAKEDGGISIGEASADTPRKSEKTKWVPIPRQELQETADALKEASHPRHHSRTHNHRSGNTHTNSQGSNSASGSVVGQPQSRIHSASQSRVHSRSQSVQSSPRIPRGRRLPPDDNAMGVSGQGNNGPSERRHHRTRASSPPFQGQHIVSDANEHITQAPSERIDHRTKKTSPPLQVRPHLQLPPQTITPLSELQYLPNGTTDIPMVPGMPYPITAYPQGQTHIPMNGVFPSNYVQTQSLDPLSPQGQQPLNHFLPGRARNQRPSPGGTPPLQPPTGYSLLRGGFPGSYPSYPMYAPHDYNVQPRPPGPHPYGPYRTTHPSQPGSGHHSPAQTQPPQYAQPPHTGHPRTQQKHPRDRRDRPSTNLNAHPGRQNTLISRAERESQVVRPPPPELSLPVAGYHPAAAAVSSPLSVDNTTNGTGVQGGHDHVDPQGVVFGSIGIPSASDCPSPSSANNGEASPSSREAGKPFPKFSIGIAPGEAVPLGRSRARTTSSTASHQTYVSKRSRTSTAGTAEESNDEAVKVNGAKVIDLTDKAKDIRDMKWEFGTVVLSGEEAEKSPSPFQGDPSVVSSVPEQEEGVGTKDVKKNRGMPPMQRPPVPPITESNLDPDRSLTSSGSSPYQLSMRLAQLTADGSPPTVYNGAEDDIFRVKDYGYGFGSTSRESNSPPDASGQQRERRSPVQERERDHKYKDKRDMEVPVRPRRGNNSILTGYNDDRGEAKGYGRRGRGTNGYVRGGYTRRGATGGTYQQSQPLHHPQSPPFSVTPPSAHFQPIVNPLADLANGFYHGRQNLGLTTYMPMGFEGYVPPLPGAPPVHLAPSHVPPPVPTPRSRLSFPLDTTRWYLLGQLEYYLSSENMAQDFFLRQRMDSRGWVPISLIASFNRVRRLATDEQLVQDVLKLSTVVQVKKDWVRMVEWQQFVLPDAPRSVVEHDNDEPHNAGDHEQNVLLERQFSATHRYADEEEGEGETDVDGEVDDDDDVVIVMDKPAIAAPWSPEKRI